MPDPAIEKFFKERKEDWLKKNIKPSMQENEIRNLENECEQKYSMQNWLPDAAKRAMQISISTHPCTFSHPSSRKNKNGYVTSVIAEIGRKEDGYLKTGNVLVETDALGNAAALDVYSFLMLSLSDGNSLIDHIERDSDKAKQLLNSSQDSYDDLKEGFLSMKRKPKLSDLTSAKIKQVYFPVGEECYHLLSVLSNSGLMYELRGRIDKLRFSERQKELRELKRDKKFSEESFSEIYNITTIGYGGTKPQNISVLNNKNGGKARLLLSAPPSLERRGIQFPTKDFFFNSIRFYDINEPLRKLHGIFITGLDGDIPRRNLERGRDSHIESILDRIIDCMISVRSVSNEQYREHSSRLPSYQKVWLCDEHQKERAEQDEWLDSLCEAISRWIVDAYKKTIRKSVVLGPVESNYVLGMVEARREIFR